MTEDKIVTKQVIEVEDNTMYEFSLISWHYGEYTNKGMVFYVKFFDNKNSEINSRVFKFSSSRAFTEYLYLSTGSKSDPVLKTVSIITPPKSYKIGWIGFMGLLDSPVGEILLNENPTSKTVKLETMNSRQ